MAGRREIFSPIPLAGGTTIEKSSPLNAQEESALVGRRQTAGNEAARNAAVIFLLPLCEGLARRYGRPGHFEDLVSVATLAAFKAVDKFDPNRGARLASYAKYHIRTAFRDYINRISIVRSPKGEEPPIVPFHYSDDDEEDKVAIDDYVYNHAVDRETSTATANQAATPLDNLIEGEREAAIVTSVPAALDRLDERERKVIRRHDLAERPATFKEIGAALGITGERARQLHASATGKLRKELELARHWVAPNGYRNGWTHSRIKIMRKLDPELRGGALDGATQDPLAPRTPRRPGQQALLPRNKLGVYSPHGAEANGHKVPLAGAQEAP
jgi:RNA polymerase sigma-32 factor